MWPSPSSSYSPSSPSSWSPIFLTLLLSVILFLINCCDGQVWCYECAFGPSPPAGADVCRPGNFNVSSVHTIRCPHGCAIQMIYEFEPNALQQMSSTPPPTRLTTNASWIDHKKNIDAITFVIRNCADKRLQRSACEVKEFKTMIHHEKCYCFTDYCNGHDGSASLNRQNALSTLIGIGLLITAIGILLPPNHFLLLSQVTI